MNEANPLSQADIFAAVALTAAFIIVVGATGRWLTRRFGQPTVLGELFVGMLVGNLGYWLQEPIFILIMHLDYVSEIFNEVWLSGLSILEATREVFNQEQLLDSGIAARIHELLVGPEGPTLIVIAIALWIFSNLGVLFLLFMAGLESSVAEMRQLGRQTIVIAVTGIAIPLLLTLGATIWLFPPFPNAVYFFLALAISSTSIGITAGVLQDLQKLHTPEAKTILGAAVLDDALSLILFTIAVGSLVTGEIQFFRIFSIVLMAFLFFGVVIKFGDWLAERGLVIFRFLDQPTYKLLYPIVLVFLMAWLANLMGLAALIGAFAAGLILNEDRYAGQANPGPSMKEMVAPFEIFLAPMFFVLIGMQVNLASLFQPGVPWLVLILALVAVLGKLATGLAAKRQFDRLSIGIGLIPRGEMTLIFASIGRILGVLPDPLFSVLVIVVIITALVTPVSLRWSLSRHRA